MKTDEDYDLLLTISKISEYIEADYLKWFQYTFFAESTLFPLFFYFSLTAT